MCVCVSDCVRVWCVSRRRVRAAVDFIAVFVVRERARTRDHQASELAF